MTFALDDAVIVVVDGGKEGRCRKSAWESSLEKE